MPFEPLNNFSAHLVRVWGVSFLTAEHAYHWRKFSPAATDAAEKIFLAASPNQAKEIAYQNMDKLPSDWWERRVEVMEEVLRAKALQHEEVRDALRRTAQRAIIESSPVDAFWGTGPDGTGENMVGKLWMKIRGELISG